jgi:hypothetical protein
VPGAVSAQRLRQRSTIETDLLVVNAELAAVTQGERLDGVSVVYRRLT